MPILSIGKSESPNKKLTNITRALLMKSSHKKELWCFAYQYATWLPWQTENRLRGHVTYLLWYGTRPSYKHIKIWGVIISIIDGRVTRKNVDGRSHHGYFIVYASTAVVILYWKPDHPFVMHISHQDYFDEYNYRLSIEYKHTPSSLLLQQDPESLIHN